MGAHEAYHRSGTNRVLHWVCIPLELWAVIKLASLVPLGPIHLAWVLVAIVAPIYVMTDWLMGAAMVALLASGAYSATYVLPDSPVIGAVSALALFAISFGAQVLIGHGVFEKGRDDTEKNLRELRKTKNPIPILLVFYYHLVEVFLALGYKPDLRREIESFKAREMESWE